MQVSGYYFSAFACGAIVYIFLIFIMVEAAFANHKQIGHATLVCEASQQLNYALLRKKDDIDPNFMRGEERVHALLKDISDTIQTEGNYGFAQLFGINITFTLLASLTSAISLLWTGILALDNRLNLRLPQPTYVISGC